jgi:hypothetical protein
MPQDLQCATMTRDHGLTAFDVPYEITGTVRIYATDAASAKAAVDAISPRHYAEDGALETFMPKDDAAKAEAA